MKVLEHAPSHRKQKPYTGALAAPGKISVIVLVGRCSSGTLLRVGSAITLVGQKMEAGRLVGATASTRRETEGIATHWAERGARGYQYYRAACTIVACRLPRSPTPGYGGRVMGWRQG
jgi:hypothetical protein